MKTVFRNKWFYRLLIIYIFLLLIWNSFMVIKGDYLGLIAVIIELFLLYLLFNKHKLAKPAIMVWAVFLIIGPGLVLLGKLIKFGIGDELNSDLDELIKHLLLLTFGIIIYYFNKTTVLIQPTKE